MAYDLNYCICSIFFLAITAYSHARQRKLANIRNRIYGILLQMGLVSLLLDIAAAAIDPVALNVPAAVKYVVNMLFLTCIQLNGPVFLLYAFVLVGVYTELSRLQRGLVFAPFAVVLLFILIAPVCRYGIFYIAADGLYTHGTMHFVLYMVMALYLIAGVVTVFIHRKRVQTKKSVTIYLFILVTIVTMAIQASNPNLLLNTTANALALTMMYHILQSPSDHIDPLTGVFNRAAFAELLNDLREQNQTFSVFIYKLRSLRVINHTVGLRTGDMVLVAFAEYLQGLSNRNGIVRISGDSFCVIDLDATPATAEQVEKTIEAMPEKWIIGENEIILSMCAAGIDSSYCTDVNVLMNLVDSISREMHEDGEDVIIVDEEFQKRCDYNGAVENALKNALDRGTVEVHYQPLHRADGSLGALEALCRIRDPELGSISPDVFVRIAEQNGSIFRLGQQVLRKTMEFVQEYDVASWGLDHIGVNLSIAQCMQSGFSDFISNIVDFYGVPHSLISFEITETEAVTSMAPVRENMQSLIDDGFSFLLDDFGTGYANFDYISKLPFFCVKIDKSILWQAMNDENQMALMRGIIDVISRLDLASVCEGVETEEQAQLLRELNITFQQGYLYSRALPPHELNDYARKYMAGRG